MNNGNICNKEERVPSCFLRWGLFTKEYTQSIGWSAGSLHRFSACVELEGNTPIHIWKMGGLSYQGTPPGTLAVSMQHVLYSTMLQLDK